MSENYLLLSIRPKHAEKIFAGIKGVELRKNRPRRLGEGDSVIVYVSHPVMAILGGFTASSIMELSPEDLWEIVQDNSGLSRSEYDSYYSGSLAAVGIMVNDPWILDQPISLSDLKSHWPNFHPPQAFQYLSQDQVESIFSHFGK